MFLTKLSGIIVGKMINKNIRAETVEQGCPEINLVWADNSNVFISKQPSGTSGPFLPVHFIGKFTENN